MFEERSRPTCLLKSDVGIFFCTGLQGDSTQRHMMETARKLVWILPRPKQKQCDVWIVQHIIVLNQLLILMPSGILEVRFKNFYI